MRAELRVVVINEWRFCKFSFYLFMWKVNDVFPEMQLRLVRMPTGVCYVSSSVSSVSAVESKTSSWKRTP